MARVLIFSPLYEPSTGGSATFFSNLVNDLSGTHIIYVITSYHPNEPIVTTGESRVILRIIPRFEGAPSPFRLLLESLPAFLAALIIILFKRIDLVHTHSTSFSTIGIALASIIGRRPIIYDCQDEGFPRRLVKIGNTPAWFSCAPNIDALLQEAGIPDKKIVRVPVTNPPYIQEYIPNDPTSNPCSFEVLFVGALRELKGIPTLLEGFEQYSKEGGDGTLRIIGSGPLEDELIEFSNNSSESDKITFMGETSHRTTLQHIVDADVLVLPSKSEGVPRVVTEALELGTPVVTTRVGGIERRVTAGYNGLFINRSSDSLADALHRMENDRELRDQLSQNAMVSAEEWNWEAVVERVNDTYTTICY